MNWARIMINYKTTERFEIKVCTDVVVCDFIKTLSEILNIEQPEALSIQAEPLGRLLDRNATLVNEGVADGALLTLI